MDYKRLHYFIDSAVTSHSEELIFVSGRLIVGIYKIKLISITGIIGTSLEKLVQITHFEAHKKLNDLDIYPRPEKRSSTQCNLESIRRLFSREERKSISLYYSNKLYFVKTIDIIKKAIKKIDYEC